MSDDTNKLQGVSGARATAQALMYMLDRTLHVAINDHNTRAFEDALTGALLTYGDERVSVDLAEASTIRALLEPDRMSDSDKFHRIYPKAECQADPVFLLQSRTWVCKNIDNYEWDDAEECLRDQGGVEVDTKYQEGHSDDWEDVWSVEGVFFDRAEAQAWGDARSYRWGAHRTYAVSALGDLANILAPMTTYYDGEPYKKVRHD